MATLPKLKDIAKALHTSGLDQVPHDAVETGKRIVQDFTPPPDWQTALSNTIATLIDPHPNNKPALAQGVLSPVGHIASTPPPSARVLGMASSPQSPSQIEKNIRNGFLKFNPHTPAATLSAAFAKAGEGLPDPYMPAVLALKETGGGRHLTDANNYLNILHGGPGNSPYEKPEYGIEGGGGHKGFPGVIRSGVYNDYLKSGNLQDFFQHYTPATDPNNPSYDKQISDYNQLRGYFTSE